MGCCSGIAGCLLYLFNLVFFLGGATILGLGIYLEVDTSGLSVGGVTIPGASSNSGDIWQAAVATFLAVGAFTFIVSFLGCCGVHKKSSCLLGLYGFLVGLTLLAELVAGILAVVFSSQIDGSLQTAMSTQIHQDYINQLALSSDSPDAISYTWNLAQSEWECCGSTNYSNYQNSKFDLNNTATVPFECCVLKQGSSKSNPSIGNVLNYTACQLEAEQTYTITNDYQYIYSEGCYTKIDDWKGDNSPIIIGVAFGFAIIQLLGLLMSCCIRNDIKKHMMVV